MTKPTRADKLNRMVPLVKLWINSKKDVPPVSDWQIRCILNAVYELDYQRRRDLDVQRELVRQAGMKKIAQPAIQRNKPVLHRNSPYRRVQTAWRVKWVFRQAISLKETEYCADFDTKVLAMDRIEFLKKVPEVFNIIGPSRINK